MSSSIQQAAINIQQDDYVTLAIMTAVGYDYVLTLSKEIEYIWSEPWTFVSTMFILVRYSSLCAFVTVSVGIILDIIHQWTYLIFFGIADFLMMLRIWAMYSRSTMILATLIVLLFLEIVATIVAVAIMSEPNNNQLAAVVHVLEFSECILQSTTPVWISSNVAVFLQMTYSVVLCVLAIIQWVRQTLQMHRLTKGWHINRCMSLFVTQGVIYFFVFVLLNLISMLGVWVVLQNGWQTIALNVIAIVPVYTLIPRFIISVRELFVRDVRGGGVDAGFGLSTLSVSGADGTMMVFADEFGQNEGMGDGEELQMDSRLELPRIN